MGFRSQLPYPESRIAVNLHAVKSEYPHKQFLFRRSPLKRISGVWCALLLLAAASSTVSAQQSVYMLMDPIRGDQPAPHDREFKLSSFSSSSMTTVSPNSVAGDMTAAKPTFSSVKVSMRYHAASGPLFRRAIAAGTKLPSVEIRHYNSTNRLLYKTVFENVYLTSVATEAADEAQEMIEFVYSRVRWFAPIDAAGLTVPVQGACWDVALVKIC